MSYIEVTGKKAELGQYADIQFTCPGMDIRLSEGRVHIDAEDMQVLKKIMEDYKEE